MARMLYSDLKEKCSRLENENSRLSRELKEVSDDDDDDYRPRNAFLTSQLELLADEVRFGSLNTSPEQMDRLLRGIARGDDWRHGTWK